MNLLVFNIRTDADHPTQGVTTRWLNELSQHFDQISVITMHKGRLALRENIAVYSVGGEIGASKIEKFFNFYRLLQRLCRENSFDACFAHMAVLFVVMGGPLLALKGIPIVTWYAHSVVNPVMAGAFLLSRAIVTASPDSFRIASSKVHVTGHGIDTRHYRKVRTEKSEVFTIGSVGRISRVKRYEILLQAIRILMMAGRKEFQVVLYGNLQTRDDYRYMAELASLAESLGVSEMVSFPGPVTGDDVPLIASYFDVFVNMLGKGGAGKAVLEAMSMEVPTVVCTPAYNDSLSLADRQLLVFQPDDPKSMAEKLERLLAMPGEEREKIGRRLRTIVLKSHSLERLAGRIYRISKSFNY